MLLSRVTYNKQDNYRYSHNVYLLSCTHCSACNEPESCLSKQHAMNNILENLRYQVNMTVCHVYSFRRHLGDMPTVFLPIGHGGQQPSLVLL